jgi:hypothetical protein
MNSYEYEQAKKQATLKTKKYLKQLGYNDVLIHCQRGTFHLTNGVNYFLDAATVLSKATGLKFNSLNAYMARLDKTQFQN